MQDRRKQETKDKLCGVIAEPGFNLGVSNAGNLPNILNQESHLHEVRSQVKSRLLSLCFSVSFIPMKKEALFTNMCVVLS
jgi:hypothetical protein